MKVALAFLALIAAVAAQDLGDVIHKEVQALLAADPGLTIDGCTTKCDALFDFVDPMDEQHSDDLCKHACDCEINKNCDIHHTHPTHPTDHPHPTHPTHHPHPTHPF